MTPAKLASTKSTPPAWDGILYAFLAYGSWGLLPIYWKAFGTTPAVEVLCHRIIWSAIFLAIILRLRQRLGLVAKLLRDWRLALGLSLSAILLACNWGIYIYGVNADRVVETSLGYFINPLLSVLLGVVVLKEQLNRIQIVAVLLAALGVTYFIWQLGMVPWVAIALAVTFGLYGLLRKLNPADPMVGLTFETIVLMPVALIIVTLWQVSGTGSFGSSGTITLLFVGCGVMTSMPLLWFSHAIKRLRLATMGFLQYCAPSIQLTLGVFLYQEPFTQTHLVTFSLIWTALALYSTDTLIRQARQSSSRES